MTRADQVCARSGKIKHATYEAALAALRALRRSGKFTEDMSAYPCGKHFHIGRSQAKLKRRIRQALRRWT